MMLVELLGREAFVAARPSIARPEKIAMMQLRRLETKPPAFHLSNMQAWNLSCIA
jgi:hypothetical protein